MCQYVDLLCHLFDVRPYTVLVETIAHGGDIVRLTHRSHTVHGFVADIHCTSGVDLPLLLTTEDAVKIVSAARLRRNFLPGTGPISLFFSKLPRELRDKVYNFLFPRRHWSMEEEVGRFTELDLIGSLGDPSGFYFLFAIDSELLMVNQQMREGILLSTYGKTSLQLKDIDDTRQAACRDWTDRSREY